MKTSSILLGCYFGAAIFHTALAEKPETPQPAAAKNADKPPGKGVTAVVLGKEITEPAGNELNGTIIGALFRRYTEETKLKATDADLDAHAAAMERMMAATNREYQQQEEALEKELRDTKLAEAERKKKEDELALTQRLLKSEREDAQFRKANPELARKGAREVAEQFVLAWKLNQSLFQKYGGRVIFQQAGAEPLDAYRKFLEEREKGGDFKIVDETARKKFWEYFVNEKMHVFMSEADGKEAMAKPWWLAEKPAR